MEIFAYDLQAGMTFSGPMGTFTVAEVTRRDNRWVSNGVVYLRTTDGHTLGFSRYEKIHVGG